MRFSVRHAFRQSPLVALAIVVSGTTCNFPTDKSNEVTVLIEAPKTFLLRGNEMSVRARAFRVVGGTDTVEVPNVDFIWISGSSSTARVDKDCCGYATVTGVNRGIVDITAQAVAFENANDGDLSIRVVNPLEIDSVRPGGLHYGQVVTVYGIGVDSIFFSTLGGVDLVEYPFSKQRNDTSGVAQVSYWVPPPARSGNLFYLGAGVFGFADSITTVIDSADVYEPNNIQPSLVNLDAPGPIPQIPALLFINPALSFEPQPRDSFGVDWYRLGQSDTTRPVTVIFKEGPAPADTSRPFGLLSDSITYSAGFYDTYFLAGQTWFMKPGDFDSFQSCGPPPGVFFYTHIPPDSTVLALKTLPSRMIHLFTAFAGSGHRYGIAVEAGYRTADPSIGPDRFEENDLCKYADENFARIPIVLTSGGPDFVDGTLTIDNPGEIDWYMFRVLGAVPVAVSIVSASRRFDGSDIDLYLVRPSDASNPLAIGYNSGPDDSVSVLLDPGDYLLAVVDFPSRPTRYGLCMTTSLSGCIAPAPAEAQVARAQRVPLREKPPIAQVAPGDRLKKFLDKWGLRSPRP